MLIKLLAGILLIGLGTSTVFSDESLYEPSVSNNLEVKAKTSSYFLSEIGLTTKDLDWGSAVNGVQTAVLFLPNKDPKLSNQGVISLVCSINNQGAIPLVIPIINGLPMISFYANKGTTRTLLYQLPHASSFGGAGAIQLGPGKMISFMRSYPVERFNNKDNLPMLLTVEVSSQTNAADPDSATEFLVESKQVKLSNLP